MTPDELRGRHFPTCAKWQAEALERGWQPCTCGMDAAADAWEACMRDNDKLRAILPVERPHPLDTIYDLRKRLEAAEKALLVLANYPMYDFVTTYVNMRGIASAALAGETERGA